ncbi:GFA family protein [Nereida sp.]|uniref:GFA family protein n=1 Tax=Nereida sp. TaxID=2736090 RepID=UPI003F6A3233
MRGSCLCGGCSFEVTEPVTRMAACHCTQCRKQSGHYWAAGQVSDTGISITGAVSWFASSQTAQRGFCPTCGSVLFWKLAGEPSVSFSLGAIDGPTQGQLDEHIHVGAKGDYYTIADDLPQREN